MRRALVAAAVLCTASRAHADGSRLTLNAGFPELVGIGYGHRFGEWRVQADVGAIVVVNTATVGVQRFIVRQPRVAVGVGVHATGLWAPPIIGEYPDSDLDIAAGTRAFVELGSLDDGAAFVVEGGAFYWRDPEDTFGRGESHIQAALTLRIAINWPTE